MRRLATCLIVAAFVAAGARLSMARQKAADPKSTWTISSPQSKGEPRGYVQFQDYCAVCHGEGAGKPGTIALQAEYKGAKPALLAKRTDLTPQMIRTCVRHGIGPMPSIRKTEVSDADLQAIVSYLTRRRASKTP